LGGLRSGHQRKKDRHNLHFRITEGLSGEIGKNFIRSMREHPSKRLYLIAPETSKLSISKEDITRKKRQNSIFTGVKG